MQVRVMMGGVVARALPRADAANALVRVVMREILTNCVMAPVLNLFKPPLINRLLFMLLRTDQDDKPAEEEPAEVSAVEPPTAEGEQEAAAQAEATPVVATSGSAEATDAAVRPLQLRTLLEGTPSITAIPIVQLDDLVSGSRCVQWNPACQSFLCWSWLQARGGTQCALHMREESWPFVAQAGGGSRATSRRVLHRGGELQRCNRPPDPLGSAGDLLERGAGGGDANVAPAWGCRGSDGDSAQPATPPARADPAAAAAQDGNGGKREGGERAGGGCDKCECSGGHGHGGM